MRLAYDVASVRAAEEVLLRGLPEGTLMDRAAAGLAATCSRLLAERRGAVYGARVVLLVGRGGNGGDALHAGARLARRGAHVVALPVGVPATDLHDRGRADLLRSGGRLPAEPSVLAGADLVLDGIVGIGGRGALRDEAAALVSRAEASDAVLVAVDVPSGVDASTGEVAGAAVHADVTVTFGAEKVGLVVDPGREHAGLVELVDIGLSGHLRAPAVELLEVQDVAALLPAPTGESDKYRRGVLGVLAGSEAYTGAAVLAVGAAVRAGAGMVRYLGPPHPSEQVRAAWPEAVVGKGRVQAYAAGPGTGTDEDASQRLDAVVAAAGKEDVPLLLDADALTLLASDPREPAEVLAGVPTVLTPHAGELARLLEVPRGDVEARRFEHVREASRRTGAVVLLKGSTTLVAAPDGLVRVNPTGTPWLATAGSGDVLTGVLGALLAGGLAPYDAASVGAYVHGSAGRLAADDSTGFATGGRPVTASDVLSEVPRAMALLRRLAGGAGR